MSELHELTLTLDGVTFRGRIPFTTNRELPELGRLLDGRDVERFEGKTVRRIRALGLRGPQSFNFCRAFCELGVQQLADLLDVDRRTVSRWQHGDVEVSKPVMALLALLAEERSRGKSKLMDQLSRDEIKWPIEIDVDAA